MRGEHSTIEFIFPRFISLELGRLGRHAATGLRTCAGCFLEPGLHILLSGGCAYDVLLNFHPLRMLSHAFAGPLGFDII